jgi:drug/metabolite transporter (DMT)-like permease
MLAVGLALCSAALFGGLSVALRYALRRVPDAEVGALVTGLVAIVVCGSIALAGAEWHGNVVPFLLAGLIAPGASQIFYVLAVRDAGPSRTAVLVGVAPLASVAIALIALHEPLRAPLIAGALLIVLGGAALAGERVRPETFRSIGIAFALASTVFFATRDNVVRHLFVDTDVPPQLAATATLVSGSAVMTAYLLIVRGQAFGAALRRALVPFVPSGLLWGSSYVALFEAFSRGRVTVVSPLVATESLFGVLFATLLLLRSELVGRHLLAGALLIVAGGALFGVFR